SLSAGLPLTGKGHGVNFADLADDGRLHLLVASGGLYPGDLESTAVYRPTTRPARYLAVRLIGTRSNRDALGARLTLWVEGRASTRHVAGGSGFGWAPTRQHFGLGEARTAGPLVVHWPSGLEERIETLPSNASIEITEGRAASWRTVSKEDSTDVSTG
ncbi:MAG: ASPIC/UnbV domain-containing protein, partial [Acidobacteriota bacterium]